MSTQIQTQTHVEESQNGDALEVEEEQVMEIANKVGEYRESVPHHLKNTLTTLLVAQRPPLLNTQFDIVRPIESANETSSDQENAKKLELLKQKISSNASAIPVLLKRMKDCMDRMHKLQSNNGVIHPAFKRKRPS